MIEAEMCFPFHKPLQRTLDELIRCQRHSGPGGDKYNPGDMVNLKGTKGPKMRVINMGYTKESARCFWLDKFDQPHEAWISTSMLDLEGEKKE